MTDSLFYNSVLIGWVALAVLTIPYLVFAAAPYGRHARSGWGPTIENRWGWFLMEFPSPLVFFLFFLFGTKNSTPAAYAFLFMYLLHYLNRSIVYPLRLPANNARMPVVIMGSGIFFNLINGYMQGGYLFELSPGYDANWLVSPQFIAGAALFGAGFFINNQSDAILRGLRKDPADKGYKIPYGGMYRFISAPNYFGETLEWTGWAVATWSLPGAAFAFWTAANLFPRAVKHHQWYKNKFPDYPKDRKAIIPFVW